MCLISVGNTQVLHTDTHAHVHTYMYILVQERILGEICGKRTDMPGMYVCVCVCVCVCVREGEREAECMRV